MPASSDHDGEAEEQLWIEATLSGTGSVMTGPPSSTSDKASHGASEGEQTREAKAGQAVLVCTTVKGFSQNPACCVRLAIREQRFFVFIAFTDFFLLLWLFLS